MKSISLNPLTTLQNGEFLNASQHVIVWYEEQGPEQLSLTDRLDDLKTGVEVLSKVFQQENQSKLSPELKAKQKARIDIWKALRKALESYVLREAVSQESSARILLDNYNFHNTKNSRVSVPQLTASIDALLKDWAGQPKLAAAVETNQLQKWIEDLAKINSEVNIMYRQRFEGKLKPADIKTKRQEMKAIMDELLTDTIAHVRLSANPAPYQIILDRVQYMMDNYKTINKIRTAERKSKSQDDGPPAPSTGQHLF